MVCSIHVCSGLRRSLFCVATFALNFGPNVSTYVLPASSFPQRVRQWRMNEPRVAATSASPTQLATLLQIRGTFHGLSAASGKVG